jgi:kanamycin kinase
LFWAIWSLSYNLKTEQYNDYFLELYGKENYDEEVLKLIACIETFG